MTENEKINGWTFEETIQCAENLMEEEKDIFKWDVLRHLRDFAENYKEEIQQYRAIGTVEELQAFKNGDCMNDCEHYDNCSNYIYSKGYAKAIDEFAEQICDKVSEESLTVMLSDGFRADVVTLDYVTEIAVEIAEQLKGVQE